MLEVYHVRHRVYDPADGRWLQPDPIGHAGGWNLYEYGGGDYANTIDPWGLEPGERAFRASLALVSPEAHRLELDARRQFQVESYRRLQGPVEFVFGAGEVLYGIVSGAPQFIVALATDPIGTIGGIPAAVVHGVQALINDVRGAIAGTDPGSGAELSAAERARRAGRAAANAVLVAFSGAKAAEWASNVVRPTRGAAPPAPAAGAAAAAVGSSVQSITSGCAAGATVGSRLLAGTGAIRPVVFARPVNALVRVGDSLVSPYDALRNPGLLAGKGPVEVNLVLGRVPGWRVEGLGQGRHAGQGWVLREYTASGSPTGRMLRWHPGGGRHGNEPYWRATSPEWGRSDIIPAGHVPQ